MVAIACRRSAVVHHGGQAVLLVAVPIPPSLSIRRVRPPRKTAAARRLDDAPGQVARSGHLATRATARRTPAGTKGPGRATSTTRATARRTAGWDQRARSGHLTTRATARRTPSADQRARSGHLDDALLASRRERRPPAWMSSRRTLPSGDAGGPHFRSDAPAETRSAERVAAQRPPPAWAWACASKASTARPLGPAEARPSADAYGQAAGRAFGSTRTALQRTTEGRAPAGWRSEQPEHSSSL